MHRMRHHTTKVGLTLTFSLVFIARGSADLIPAPEARTFPEIAALIEGAQTYVYDPATRTGTFRAANTPLLMSTGPVTATDEVAILPTADGTRRQMIRVTLDDRGHLVNSPENAYTLLGSAVVGGKTYTGLLLRATPTAFGFRAGGASAFNLELKVTGGALAATFGPDAYLELHPGFKGAFDGRFDRSFSAVLASSNTQALHSPSPIPSASAEPTALMLLLACGAGLLVRTGSRVSREDLEV